jgi:hypothetical protein
LSTGGLETVSVKLSMHYLLYDIVKRIAVKNYLYFRQNAIKIILNFALIIRFYYNITLLSR